MSSVGKRAGLALEAIVGVRIATTQELCCPRMAQHGEHAVQTGDDSLRPTMPATISARLAMRPAVAGSPSSTMPRIAVPTAPTPTQTAYDVPTGSDFIARPSSPRLTI